MKGDQKFCSLINVNNLDHIYREYFSHTFSSTAGSEQTEYKNRLFKDLYNIIEDSVYKFYEIFTAY